MAPIRANTVISFHLDLPLNKSYITGSYIYILDEHTFGREAEAQERVDGLEGEHPVVQLGEMTDRRPIEEDHYKQWVVIFNL